MIPVIGAALGVLGKIIEQPLKALADYLEHKNKMREIKLQGAQRLAEMKLTGDQAWEVEQVARSGWKDEFVLLAIWAPLILVFIPSMVPHVSAGFEALGRTVPEWWTATAVMLAGAVYGIRPMVSNIAKGIDWIQAVKKNGKSARPQTELSKQLLDTYDIHNDVSKCECSLCTWVRERGAKS